MPYFNTETEPHQRLCSAVLLKAFPSTADLKNASVEEISQYVPISVAKEIKNKLENN